jgi:uncharacterized protein (DUF362 family)
MNCNSEPSNPDRRNFLLRGVRATLMAAGSAMVGLGLWRRSGGRPDPQEADAAPLPNYTLPRQTDKLAVAHGDDRSQTVRLALDALGGLVRFIQTGDRVLLKVNAAFASAPILGATTHPDLVAAVTRMCFAAGASRVLVTDNPIGDPAGCFELTGIGPAARTAGAKVIYPQGSMFEAYTVPQADLIRQWPVLCAPLRQVDKLIGLCPVKDHQRSGASMTIKNWYGLLGGRRNIFHQQIHTIIAELAVMIAPSLVILDGTQTMMRNGPTGGSMDDLKATRTLIAGTDPVAVDAMGAGLLGKTAADLPHLALAEKAGAGTVDYQSLKPVIVNSE